MLYLLKGCEDVSDNCVKFKNRHEQAFDLYCTGKRRNDSRFPKSIYGRLHNALHRGYKTYTLRELCQKTCANCSTGKIRNILKVIKVASK